MVIRDFVTRSTRCWFRYRSTTVGGGRFKRLLSFWTKETRERQHLLPM